MATCIDLGLGRAPGTDQLTARASAGSHVPRGRFPARRAGAAGLPRPIRSKVSSSRAVPGEVHEMRRSGLVGPSLYGAQARRGAWVALGTASRTSRWTTGARWHGRIARTVKPPAQLDRPYAMLTVNVFAGGYGREARYLLHFASAGVSNLRRGRPDRCRRRSMTSKRFTPRGERYRRRACARLLVGCPTVKQLSADLSEFLARQRGSRTSWMIAGHFFDGHAARLRSLEITAAARDRDQREALNTSRTPAIQPRLSRAIAGGLVLRADPSVVAGLRQRAHHRQQVHFAADPARCAGARRRSARAGCTRPNCRNRHVDRRP